MLYYIFIGKLMLPSDWDITDTRDGDLHCVFIETSESFIDDRNFHINIGDYVLVTSDDTTLKLS